MFNPINIAIDSQAATGKTSIGSELAKMLNYKFIDTGLFYRYFAFKFINHNVDNLSEEIVKSEITTEDLEQINLNISNQYLQIGARASEISKNNDVRSAINDLIKRLTIGKGFVVVGRDVTTKILPDAEVKIVLDADVETRLFRRMKQMNLENECDTILNDLLQRDFNSHDLIQQAKQISTIIDTQNLSSEQVIHKIFKIVIFYSLQHSKFIQTILLFSLIMICFLFEKFVFI